MSSEHSHPNDPEAVDRERTMLRLRIQHAADACGRPGHSTRAGLHTLVEALQNSATLELNAGEFNAAGRFLEWAIPLCEDQLTTDPSDQEGRSQLVTALRALSDVHRDSQNLDEAADCCDRIASVLDSKDNQDRLETEQQLLVVQARHDLALIRRQQGNLVEALAVNSQAHKTASRLAIEFPDDDRCLQAVIRSEQLAERLAADSETAKRAKQKRSGYRGKTAAAIVAGIVIGLLKLGVRNGWFGGNAPQPPARINFDGLANLFNSTIEYLNNSPAPCTVRLVGYKFDRRRSYEKEIQPGASGEVRESIESFTIEQIIVESAGQSQTAKVLFELPSGGLAQVKVDDALGAQIIKVSDRYRPQGRIAKPADNGPRVGRKRNDRR